MSPSTFVRSAVVVLGLVFVAPSLHASPFELLPVGDRLEAELRVLDLYAPGAAGGRVALPHLHTRPLARLELFGEGAPAPRSGARAIALARLERALARDASAAWRDAGAFRSTPRLAERGDDATGRAELSFGIEGGWDATGGDGPSTDGRFDDGTGVHMRASLGVDRWLAHVHGFAGHFEGGQRFADPLFADTDVILHSEEAYVAYAGTGPWGAWLGRGRWHWGPGDEGSLLLSKTSAPITGVAWRARVASIGLDATALSASTDAASGEQLAAHRLEWQPASHLRFGLTETARYRADGWLPLYAAGVLPYIVVQRLLAQDSPDSADATRNNVQVGFDASWRVADGTRVYGEWLVDDLHAKSANFPNKYGWQAGVDGAGEVRGTRVSWNLEATRLSRFVYTSYFGRAHAAQERPLGFPTGPDSRRVRARVAWDPNVAWQVSLHAAHTTLGESGLNAAFVPGDPVPDVGTFAGVAERTREWGASVRWWPASGVDLSAGAAWRARENADHRTGVENDSWSAGVRMGVTR